MDNQPLQPMQPKQPVQPRPASQPTNIPGDYTNPSTPVNTATGDVVLEAGKKKRKKLIITLVSIFAVLLVGGGAFAAAVIISNQPENIALSAFNNLINAKQIVAEGSINLSLSESENIGVKNIKINLQEQASGISHSSTANLEVDFTNSTEPLQLQLGEAMMSNGVLYIKAEGLNDAYQKNRDNFATQLKANQYNETSLDCDEYLGNEYYNSCVATISEYENSSNTQIQSTLDQIEGVIQQIDGQWIKVSIEEIANSGITEGASQESVEIYNCLISTYNNFSNYSNEFSDLYTQNAFISLTSAPDSFYNISLDANKLTNYLNAIPKTRFASDVANCANTTIPEEISLDFTTDQVNSMLNSLPQISAKFDGLFNHHLTDLRINSQSEYYNLNATLNLSYPGSVNISEPEEARSIVELITEIMPQTSNVETQETVITEF